MMYSLPLNANIRGNEDDTGETLRGPSGFFSASCDPASQNIDPFSRRSPGLNRVKVFLLIEMYPLRACDHVSSRRVNTGHVLPKSCCGMDPACRNERSSSDRSSRGKKQHAMAVSYYPKMTPFSDTQMNLVQQRRCL